MYTEQTFTTPSFASLSSNTIDEHKKLYAGYVKNANLVLEKLHSYKGDESKAYETAELYRQFSFEFNGMRNHECYFTLLSGKSELVSGSPLLSAINTQWGIYKHLTIPSSLSPLLAVSAGQCSRTTKQPRTSLCTG